MFKYVSKRLGLMLFTFCIIFVMCFVLVKLLPIHINVGPGAGEDAQYIMLKNLEGKGWITNIQKGDNGLYTYDRALLKVTPTAMTAMAKRLFDAFNRH